MPQFNRFDICEAYLALEWDYHNEGILWERRSNKRNCRSTDVQLRKMQFKPSPMFRGFESLTENGKEIYHEQVKKLNLPVPECCECLKEEFHADECSHQCEENYCGNFENWFYNGNE